MPGDDGFPFNDDESGAPLGSKAQEPDPEESVLSSKFWTIDGTFQDDDLVSQGEDLSLEREARSKAGKKDG
jgi:hypothetical protein